MVFFIIFVVLLVIILLFSSPVFSPVPYFPSNKNDLPQILNALNLKNNQTVIDLGAGDGLIIFEAAKLAKIKKINTKFIAIDINPILIVVMYIKKIFHPNRKNINIVFGDMFKINLKIDKDPIFYLYISPWLIDKTLANIRRQKLNCSIVSYMYPVLKLTKNEKIIQGKNKIFVYKKNNERLL